MFRFLIVTLFLTLLNPSTQCASQDTNTVATAYHADRRLESLQAVMREKPITIGVVGSGGFAFGQTIHGYLGRNYLGRSNVIVNFASAGIHLGKVVSSPSGAGRFVGQLEIAGEFLPLWLAIYPKQGLVFRKGKDGVATNPYVAFGYTVRGVSVTPAIIRWNFTFGRRLVPWSQVGCGVLWTVRNFPYDQTSSVNFTPQLGFGTHVFIKPRQSLDFSVNAVHISNGSIADHNPGVNATLQFGMGYTWWK